MADVAVDLEEERRARHARIDAFAERRRIGEAVPRPVSAETTELSEQLVEMLDDDPEVTGRAAWKEIGGEMGYKVFMRDVYLPEYTRRHGHSPPRGPRGGRRTKSSPPTAPAARAPRVPVHKPAAGDRIAMHGKLGSFDAVPCDAGGFELTVRLRGVSTSNTLALLDTVRAYLFPEVVR